MSTIICHAEHLGKTIHGSTTLSDASFTLQQGDSLAITGPSGSGKTTLLNILGLIESRSAGQLTLFGQPAPAVNSSQARRLLRDNIGYLFQNFALIDNDTIDNNLKIAQTYAHGTTAHKREQRSAALSQVGLHANPKRKAYELSGGEQQRLAIARLMLKPCDLVLADEPTGSLDPGNRTTVLELLDQLTDLGKSLIIVTHDPLVAAHCDHQYAITPPRRDDVTR